MTINIDGMWISKDGKNIIYFIQPVDKFEGYMGSPDNVRISLGTISERTLNFKQTWHKGRNKGAVATVYGRVTSDDSAILLEFEGTRANGKGMKGKNAIYRKSLIGSWTPMDLGKSGDSWNFILKSRLLISGYYEPKQKERIILKGKRNNEDVNFFTISLQSNDTDCKDEEINGEYRCPNILLTLPTTQGQKTLVLQRKQLFLPKKKNYDPFPTFEEKSASVILSTNSASLPSVKRPCRDESQVTRSVGSRDQSNMKFPADPFTKHDNDLRTALLSTVSVSVQEKPKEKKCCNCCIL